MLIKLSKPHKDYNVIINTDDISRIDTAAIRCFSEIFFKSGGSVIVEGTPDEIWEKIKDE